MKPPKKKWYPNGWYYDEKKGKWIGPDYQTEHGEVSPTGWVYDRDTMKWDPPESLQKESDRKWRWDPEKEIWIDREKEERLERYRQFRAAAGKPPTYEEWKAAKEKEMQKNEHPEE